MADTTKNVKIVLTADGSQLQAGLKAVITTVEQQVSSIEKVNNSYKLTAEQLAQLNNLQQTYKSLIDAQFAAYTKAQGAIERINNAHLNEVLALNAAKAVQTSYNKTIDATADSAAKTAKELKALYDLQVVGLGTPAGVREAVRPTAVYNYATGALVQTFEQQQKQIEDSQKLHQAKQEAETRAFLNRLNRLNEDYTRQYIAEEEKRNRSFAQKIADTGIYKPKSDYGISMIAGMSRAGRAAGLQPTVEELNKEDAAENKVIHTHKSLIAHIGEVISVYRLYNTAINLTQQALLSIPNTLIQLQSSTASLSATFGSAAGAARELSFINDEAQRTGISVNQLRKSYADFASSMLMAGESAETLHRVFASVNTIATTLHMTTDAVDSTFLALAQSFNKGKIQAEEMVKQLAQRLPGIYNQAAVALGMTTKELGEQMKKGLVEAHGNIDKIMQLLATTFGGEAFQKAATGLNAELGRLTTAWTHFAETIGLATETSMKNFVKNTTSVLEYLTKLTSDADKTAAALNTVAGALAAITAGVVISGLSRLVIGIGGFTSALTVLSTVVKANPWMLAGSILAGVGTKLYLDKQNADELNKSIEQTIELETRLQQNRKATNLDISAQRPEENPIVISIENQIKSQDKRIREALSKGIPTEEYQKLLSERQKLIAASARAYGEALASPIETYKQSPDELTDAQKRKAAREQYKTDLQEAQNIYKQIQANVADALHNIDNLYTSNAITLKDYFSQKEQLIRTDASLALEAIKAERDLAAAQNDKVKVAKLDGEITKVQQDESKKLTANIQEQTKATQDYTFMLMNNHAQYLALLGKGAGGEAAGIQFEKSTFEEFRRYAIEGNQQALNELETRRQNAILLGNTKDIAEQISAADAKHQAALNQVNVLLNAGAIGELTSLTRITAANEERIAQYEDMIAKQQQFVSEVEAGGVVVDVKEKDKLAKWKQELENMKLSADAVAGHFEKVFGDAFDNSFMGLVQGTTTAKQAFASFANSIVMDIGKIVAAELRSQILGNILKPMFNAAWGGLSGMFSSAETVSAASTGVAALGNADIVKPASTFNGQFFAHANGSVMSGNISKYSGSIVDKPTFFANGGNVMGEAGPEAILPLRRNAQGKLGVVAGNSGQNISNEYNVSVTVQGSRNENPADLGQKIGESIIRTIAKEEIANATRSGNTLNKSRFM